MRDKLCEPNLGPPTSVPGGAVPWQKRIHKEKCLKPEGDHANHGAGRQGGRGQRRPGEKSFSGQAFPFGSIDLRRASGVKSLF